MITVLKIATHVLEQRVRAQELEFSSLRTSGVFDPMNMSGISRLNYRYNWFYKILNSSNHILTAIKTAPTVKLNSSVKPV